MLKKILLVFVAIIACTSLALAAGGALDGKTFAGDSGEKGKTETQKDALIFADGQFHSAGCDQYGFAPTAYATKTEGDTISFESTATSEKEGTIEWKGWVKGDTCEATLVWKKTGQKDIEYWFKGTVQK